LTGELFQGGSEAALLTLKCLPAIIIAMFGLRWILMTLESPLLSLVGPRLSWQEVVFSALGGLRGGLALILAQTVLASHTATKDPQLKVGCVGRMLFVCSVAPEEVQ
jgi:NhaP-type Na+/H+ or K+/H+ antiporter